MPVTQGHGNPPWTRDETILALDLLNRYLPKLPDEHNPDVVALSGLLQRLPIVPMEARTERFRNPAGVSMKLQNLASIARAKDGYKGLSHSVMDKEVWGQLGHDPARARTLANEIARGLDVIESEQADPLDDGEEFEAVEGTVLTRVHRLRERKRGFRSRVVRRVEEAHGVARCEACEAIAKITGPIGIAMFEVHHLVPLCSAATTVTRLGDLALLCANCHRLIHAAMRQDARHYDLVAFREWLTKCAPDSARKGP